MCLLVERELEAGSNIAYKVVWCSGGAYMSPLFARTTWKMGVRTEANDRLLVAAPIDSVVEGGVLHFFAREADALAVAAKLEDGARSRGESEYRYRVLLVHTEGRAWCGQIVQWPVARDLPGLVACAATPVGVSAVGLGVLYVPAG